MDLGKLEHLLKEDEGFKLDFKFKLSLESEAEKREFAKDVIAIANTDGGRGYILFGIEDKTKQIIGIKDLPRNMEERIQQMLASRSMPPVPVSFECVTYKGKKIGVLTIYKSKQIPHQMTQNGAFYIRRGSTTDVASRQELAKMLQYSGMVQFETIPCRHATLEDLDLKQVEQLLPYSVNEEKLDRHLLLALGIITQDDQNRGYFPTYGGLLLFGKIPQAFIHQATLEVVVGKKHQGITGSILKMLESFDILAKKVLPSDYPLEALHEVVANAIVHRDYWNTSYHTYISIDEGGICVENPSCYGYQEGSKLHLRNNAWLYSRLLLLRHKEDELHLGIGLEKVKEMFTDKQTLDIKHDQETGLFRVYLPGFKNKEENL